jgi:hypothetical protein
MSVDYEQEEETFPAVEPIHHYNPMEEAAQRYWRASRIWRDQEESNWNCGMMIQELNDIRCYRGIASPLAAALLDDVVHDRRHPILDLQPQHMIANDAETQNSGI